MASAVIDRAAVMVLVHTALAAVASPVTFMPNRKTDPEGATAYCKVLGIGLKRHERVMQGAGGPDESEEADASVAVEVGVGAGLESAHALEAATQRVLALLHEVPLTDGISGGHTLLVRCLDEPLPSVDADREIVSCVLMFHGLAQRTTGTSVLDLLN